MKYNYAVKYKGVYYPTGADVPVEAPDVPEEDNEEIADETDQEEPVEESKIYKKGDFTTWTKDAISELAESLGYTITADKKADMIDEFLEQQEQELGK